VEALVVLVEQELLIQLQVVLLHMQLVAAEALTQLRELVAQALVV
jgi:hypothetical protein